MASSVETVPAHSVQSRAPSNINPFRATRGGNRVGNRGKARITNESDSRNIGQDIREPKGRPRGGRRGRGNRGNSVAGSRNQTQNQHLSPIDHFVTPLDLPPDQNGGGSFGDRLTKDAKMPEGEVEGEEEEEDEGGEGEEGEGEEAANREQETELEVCFICASSVEHISVAHCNHRTCHICALRLRALYKTRACAHCRTEAQDIILTDDKTKRYEDYGDADFQKIDDVLGIKYEQAEIYNDTLLLLRYNCPEKSCDMACHGWPDLHRHVKSVHHKVMCDLCTRNKKVFTHEHELFTMQELRKHEKFGDDNPGAVDQSGFKGHPECGFCRQRFYGDDELYSHCRFEHEKCHLCDRRSHGREQRYYVNYNSLEDHFRQDHFLCTDRECLDKKFVVFGSEIDLKAHQLEVHPNDLSKDARRDARIVDMSAFDYRTPYQNTLGRRNREGRGRGRNPNVEAIPQSTAQPLRRDELAYQRQMAIQSAQSISTRTFGGQLTSNNVRSNNRVQDQATVTGFDPEPSFISSVEGLSIEPQQTINTNPPATETPTPQEQARRLQHNAVMDRASTLLRHDQSKISTFRSSVSSYRTHKLTASSLIDTFFTLFDVPATDLGKLIKELADIYENEAKRLDLLKAWNDWRAINEDYPSLPGPSGVLPTAVAGSGGRRVLKLKSSTAQSSQSAVSKQSSWGNTVAANPFPTMPTALANKPGAGHSATPWVTSSAPRSSHLTFRPAAKNSPLPASTTNRAIDSAFPALPAAKKPDTSIAGLSRGTVKWNESRTDRGANAWAVGTSKDVSGNSGELEGDGESIEGKKKRGKKQVVYKFG